MAQFCILRPQFCAIPQSASRRTHPLQVERAVGLIDGIIQEDAFKAMLDDFAAKSNVIKMETYYQKQCAQ